jgi:hypothetical protein
MARGQGRGAAGFARPSGELQERADTPIVRALPAEGGHMIPSQGAVPIMRNGVLEGAQGWWHFTAG